MSSTQDKYSMGCESIHCWTFEGYMMVSRVPYSAGTKVQLGQQPSLFIKIANFNSPETVYQVDSDATASVRNMEPAYESVPTNNMNLMNQINQAWYRSKDGTWVPMFIIRQRTWQRESGRHPTLLVGNGVLGGSFFLAGSQHGCHSLSLSRAIWRWQRFVEVMSWVQHGRWPAY